MPSAEAASAGRPWTLPGRPALAVPAQDRVPGLALATYVAARSVFHFLPGVFGS